MTGQHPPRPARRRHSQPEAPEPVRVEIGAAIRTAAASIRGLPVPVVLIVFGLTLIDYLIPGGDVLTVLGLFLGVAAGALVVAALVSSDARVLRPMVDLSLRRLPAAIGLELVEFGVWAIALSVILVTAYATGERPVLTSATAIVAIALTTPLVARWMCALPFVIVRSHGPIAALKASWTATRGSWGACLVLVLPIALLSYLPAFVYLPAFIGEPLRGFVSALIGAATTVIVASLGVAVYRQVGGETRESAAELRSSSAGGPRLVADLQDGSSPDVTRDVEPLADAVLTESFGALQPGEMISIALIVPGGGPITGQVLAADDDGITVFEPPENPRQPGYFEEIPADRIASITRHGSAPLTVTIADAFTGDSAPSAESRAQMQGLLRTLRASPNRSAIGFGLGAGLLVLLPQAAIGDVFGLLTLFLLPVMDVGFGLLAGLAIPGWRGWWGYSVGLITAAIVANVITAIAQPDVYYVAPVTNSIVVDAVTMIIFASVGFGSGAIVRRLR